MNDIMQKIVERINSELPEATVELKEIVKNNGIVQNGIVIRSGGKQIFPVIYIDDMLRLNYSAEAIANHALSFYENNDNPLVVILVPTDIQDVDESFDQMVRDVNQSEVLPEEQLSNHVYTYKLNGGWVENEKEK